MTLANIFSQMGATPKQLIDRYSEYPQSHEQHVYYPYETPTHVHVTSTKHHHRKGHKNNAALSALTLLAFLFFLHILQQCLRDHMTAMNTPQVMIMTSSREGDELDKTPSKLDKTGAPDTHDIDETSTRHVETSTRYDEDKYLTKLAVAEHKPKPDRYRDVLDIYKSPKQTLAEGVEMYKRK